MSGGGFRPYDRESGTCSPASLRAAVSSVPNSRTRAEK